MYPTQNQTNTTQHLNSYYDNAQRKPNPKTQQTNASRIKLQQNLQTQAQTFNNDNHNKTINKTTSTNPNTL